MIVVNYLMILNSLLLLLLLLLNNYCYCFKYARKCLPSISSIHPKSFNYKKRICAGEILFMDDFTQDLNLQIWNHIITDRDPENLHFEWYMNSSLNSFTENGILFIRPTVDFGWEERMRKYFEYYKLPFNSYYAHDVIQSARISTIRSFAFRYGRIEIRAKISTGDWLWPAIWLMPRDNIYGLWPQSGEIDIMEARGNRQLLVNGKNIGIARMGSTLHFGLSRQLASWRRTHYEKQCDTLGTEFHNYTLIWDTQTFRFFLDSMEIGRVDIPKGGFFELGGFPSDATKIWANRPSNAPFDQYFYLIFNVAVGGSTFFPDESQNEGYSKPWRNNDPDAADKFLQAREFWLPTWRYYDASGEDPSLQIDYVRIYAI